MESCWTSAYWLTNRTNENKQFERIAPGMAEVGFGFGKRPFKRGLLEKGLFRKVHLLEIVENSEILDKTPDSGKQRRIRLLL